MNLPNINVLASSLCYSKFNLIVSYLPMQYLKSDFFDISCHRLRNFYYLYVVKTINYGSAED